MSPASLSHPAATVSEWEGPLSAWGRHLLASGRSDATTAGYVHHVRALALAHETTAPDPWTLTPAMLAHYLERQHWSQGTRRRVLVSLRAFYGWAVANGHAARSPLAGLPTTAPKTRGPDALPLPPAWAEHAAAWAAHMRAGGRAESTITVRLGWLRRIASTYADPFAVTADDLALYLSRSDWSPETKRSARGTAATFYRWAVRTNRTQHNPAEQLDAVRIPRALPRPAPDEAVVAALAAADDRTRLMLMLAGLAGLRRAEVAAVHTDDFTHHADYLRVRGKGGRDRLVPLHPDLAAALTAVVARRRDGSDPGTGWTVAGTAPGWLFPSDRAGHHLSASYVGRLITECPAARLDNPHPAPPLRHTGLRRRPRPARRAGAAGPRQTRDHSPLRRRARPQPGRRRQRHDAGIPPRPLLGRLVPGHPGQRGGTACPGCAVGAPHYPAGIMSDDVQAPATRAATVRPRGYTHAPGIGRLHATVRRGSRPRPLPTPEQTPHGSTPEQHRDRSMFHPRLQLARWARRDPRAWDTVAEVAHPNLAPKYRRLAAALRTLAEHAAPAPGRTSLHLLEAARAALDLTGTHGPPSTPDRKHEGPTATRHRARQLLAAPCAPPSPRGTLASA